MKFVGEIFSVEEYVLTVCASGDDVGSRQGGLGHDGCRQ